MCHAKSCLIKMLFAWMVGVLMHLLGNGHTTRDWVSYVVVVQEIVLVSSYHRKKGFVSNWEYIQLHMIMRGRLLRNASSCVYVFCFVLFCFVLDCSFWLHDLPSAVAVCLARFDTALWLPTHSSPEPSPPFGNGVWVHSTPSKHACVTSPPNKQDVDVSWGTEIQRGGHTHWVAAWVAVPLWCVLNGKAIRSEHRLSCPRCVNETLQKLLTALESLVRIVIGILPED